MIKSSNNSLVVLKDSPMFHLSMASLELFHSNFLYWLYKINKSAFQALISSLLGTKEKWPKEWEVKREKYHYDLCIIENTSKDKDCKHSDVWLVIENKVKSLPRLDQLKKYKAETPNADGRRILLSLVKDFPLAKDNPDLGWKFINYEQLVKGLNDFFKKENSYYKRLIRDYCKSMRCLSDFVNAAFVNGFEKSSISNIKEMIEDCREFGIEDVIKKLCYGKILEMCVSKLKDDFKDVIWEVDVSKILEYKRNDAIFVNYGLTNSTGYFELKLSFDEDKLIVIQIQGNDYRRGVAFKEGDKSNRNKIELNKDLKALFSWKYDDMPQLEWPDKLKTEHYYRASQNIKGEKKEQFWSYAKDERPDQFLYQKVKIEDSMLLSELVECVKQDIVNLTNQIKNER